MPPGLQERRGSAKPSGTLPPAQRLVAALHAGRGQSSRAVTLPAGSGHCQAPAVPVGALGRAGVAQEQLPGPGEAQG